VGGGAEGEEVGCRGGGAEEGSGGRRKGERRERGCMEVES